MRRIAAAAVAALFLIAGPPARADIGAAKQALGRGDYEAAALELLPLARAGDAEAQYHLALLHEQGAGVLRNDSMAVAWLRKAAQAGHVEAMVRLANFLELGRGAPRNPKEAVDWYKKATAAGSVPAKTRLGLAHIRAIGKKPDFSRGVQLLREAAEAGDAEAKRILDALGDSAGEAGPPSPESLPISAQERPLRPRP